MLIAFDGTGVYDSGGYTADMKGSFCSQLWRGLRPNSYYVPGPGTAGGTYSFKRDGALSEVRLHYFDKGGLRTDDPVVYPNEERAMEPLYLAGYSRGGAYAMQFARDLQNVAFTERATVPRKHKVGITTRVDPVGSKGSAFSLQVEAMFLFDPVNRDAFVPDAGIPPNVRNVYVLYRDGNVENVGDGTPLGDKYGRWWMGHANTTAMDPRVTKVYGPPVPGGPGVIGNASHAAAGGAPWLDRPADEKATNDAARWMNQFLRKHHIPVTLRNLYTFPKPAGPQTLSARDGANVFAGGYARRFGQAYNSSIPNNLWVPFTVPKPTGLTADKVQKATLLVDISLPATERSAGLDISLLGASGSTLRMDDACDGRIGARTTAELELYNASTLPNSMAALNGMDMLKALLANGLQGFVNTDGVVYGVQLRIDTK